jgi:starch-binding outer membrane protein, SusD/RagB family
MSGIAFTVLPLLAACDLTVTNPGPVQANFLNDPAAVPAVVNGAGRDLAEALNYTSYTSAAVTRELHPAGSTGSFGITVQQGNGHLTIDDDNTHWNFSQRARWTAEHGIDRVKAALGDAAYAKSAQAAQILLWAGYADRHMGENFCDAVIDGGPKEPYTVFLERAEQYFTDAMTVATAAGNTTIANAARAGRASVRLYRGNTAGAAADANGIASNFVYQMSYNAIDNDQTNRIYFAGANQPYRAHTTWNTFYENYYTDTKDPRVKWLFDPAIPVGDAAVGNLGRVPFYDQQKYTSKASGINLSSGWEMRLIEAEVKLIGNDIPGALTLLNQHRVALNLAPWTATTTDEAWTVLKKERGIELWLEARRLGDLRRWKLAGRPGAVDQPAGFDVCFPIPLSELETNPNFKTG